MSPVTAMYVAQAIHGLTYGMLLFLVASGLTLIFGMMGILNLAHASFFMLSAYFCYQVVAWTDSFWIALILAPLGTGVVGILVERFLLRKVQQYNLGHIGDLLLTLGISLVIAEGVKTIWGTESHQVVIPPSLEGLVSVAGLEYPIYRLFIIGLAAVILSALAFILFKTRLGMIIRAAVSDADMVSALGINMPPGVHVRVRGGHGHGRGGRGGGRPHAHRVSGPGRPDRPGRLCGGGCGRLRQPVRRGGGFIVFGRVERFRHSVHTPVGAGFGFSVHGPGAFLQTHGIFWRTR